MSSASASQSSPPPGPESTIVYGADETGVSALATGLALRSHGRFRWVDCADVGPVPEQPTHWIFARGSAEPEVQRLEPTELELPHLDLAKVRDIVASDGGSDDGRLASYLGLPPLLQRLGSWGRDEGHGAAILMANVDALEALPGGRLLAERRLHDRLHLAGIALFATAGAAPSETVLGPFDRVYRVSVPGGVNWSHGTVAPQREPGQTGSAEPIAVREVWRRLGLEPSLLPPL